MTTLGSNCESCSTPHDGTYGSGRFCSSRCARGFSTKTRRAEINERVSQTLAGRPTGRSISPENAAKMRSAHADYYLAIPFNSLSTDARKKRVLAEQDHRCGECGINEWRGRPIVLELDHIDGNNENDSRENLVCLCPNCHSQTPTWRGRNVRIRRGKDTIPDEVFKAALRANKNIHQALQALGLSAKGNSYFRAKRLLLEMEQESSGED